MKKKWVLGLTFVFVLGLILWNQIPAVAEEDIQLRYRIIENNSTEENVTILSKLKAKNTELNPIYGLTATVYYTQNVTIDISQIYLGDMSPGQEMESAESFTISFRNSSGQQEQPQVKLVWQLRYTDVNGNSIVQDKDLLQ